MRRTPLLAAWIAGDAALFAGSYLLAYFLRVGWVLSSDFPFGRFLAVTLLVLPVFLLTLTMTRTFALLRRQATLRVFAYVAYAGVVTLAFFALGYYFLYREFFSRMLLAYALPLSVLSVWGWHVLFDGVSRRLLRASPAYPALVIGATREAAGLIEALEKNRSPLKPVGVLDGRGTAETQIRGVPVLGRLHKLDETLDKLKITHVIQCSDLEQSINLLGACRNRGITYLLLPSVLGIVERDERIDTLEGRAVTVVRPKQAMWEWFFS